MIPAIQDRSVIAGGVKNSASFEISQKDTSHIMTILRDTLYSDKIMAVLREYGANAWDANRMIGKADVPIKVTLPTVADSTLRIRDYGPGLSPDDVERIFTKYGASTKREDNLAVGMLGIGSKSGFAYSDSFTVTTWHGGVRREYVAVIDASQKGKMDLLYQECLRCGFAHSDPKVLDDHMFLRCGNPDALSETGVEISLAVRPQDIREFEARAKRLFMHFVPQPIINTELHKAPDGKRLELDGKHIGVVSEDNSWENRGKWTAVMGCVPYRVDLNQLGKVISNGEHYAAAPCASSIGGVLYFDIGELTVAASREELKYGDATRLAIIRRVNELVDEYVKQMLAGIESLTPWERRLRVRTVDNLGLPIPRDHQDLRSGWVDLKPTTAPGGTPIVRMTTKNYNGSQTESSHVEVGKHSRIVVKDDKRTIKGFSLTNKDLLISPNGGLSQASLLMEVRRMVRTANIEGISVVNLSTIPWAAPPKDGPRATRDPAKAKAQVLVLDTKTPDFGAIPLSRHWAVVSRVASDKDVYVVLDSYRVNDNLSLLPTRDFYEQWLTDDRMLKALGLELPPIIGYKEMASKPVVKSKLKGTDYATWREKGMIELLKTHKEMAKVIEAIENGGEASYDMDVGLLKDALGESHVITRLSMQVNEARKNLVAADKKLVAAARLVRSAGKAVDMTAGLRKEISEKYPLVKLYGEQVFQMYSGNKVAWVDYVKVIDLLEKVTKLEEQSKENAA